MKIKQLTLLDDQSLNEIQQNKYVVIQVHALKSNAVEAVIRQAFVWLPPKEMKVKGELFDDFLGNHYVGCKILKKKPCSESGNQIPVFKLNTTIQDYLLKQLKPVLETLDQKRRNYYAN